MPVFVVGLVGGDQTVEILANNVDTRWFKDRDELSELRKKAKMNSTPQDSL